MQRNYLRDNKTIFFLLYTKKKKEKKENIIIDNEITRVIYRSGENMQPFFLLLPKLHRRGPE